MRGKEKLISALLAGMLALSGCRSADTGKQTPLTTTIDVSKPTEQPKETSIKEKVVSFTWKDAENQEKLKSFVENLADEFLKLTKAPRLTKEGLIQKTNLFSSEQEFINKVKEINPRFAIKEERGFADYQNENVFLNLEALRRDGPDRAGLEIIDALWHEWGHLDVTERTTGELINNQDYYFFSPNSDKNEVFKNYRGGVIYTDTYYGFIRFEEVLNETIIVRRMIEQVGLSTVASTAEYYQNGTDFFPNFTSAVGISLQTLYEMHATSDFEGLAKLVGQNLPGNETPLYKGIRLFRGIHQSDADLIKETGVFNRISK